MGSEAGDQDDLWLRPIQESDCQLLWQWTNDPVVRAYSFLPDPISWETHCQWFTAKLIDPGCYMYLALDQQNNPIGQIRFDQTWPDQVEVGVSIAAAKRGLGFGKRLIQLASTRLFDDTSVTAISAFIKQENSASINAFEEAGFVRVGAVTIGNYPAFKYLKVRGARNNQDSGSSEVRVNGWLLG